jgi:hypothetical protein
MNSIFLFLNDGNIHSKIDEVHFNLWIVGSARFLDIGLKLAENQKVELYLPWKASVPEDLFDIIKDVNILNAIFNEHLSTSTSTNLDYFTVELKSEKFNIVKSDFNIEQKKLNGHDFTKLIVLAKSDAKGVSYVRFRIRDFGKNIFSNTHTGGDSLLNPYRESIEVIDFRVNELRSIPYSEIKSGKFVTPAIDKMHFFLLKSYHESNTLASPEYLRCRELEDKAWEKYLPVNLKPDDATLAYHWTKALGEGSHFSVLATFSKKKTSLLIRVVPGVDPLPVKRS